MSTIPAVPSAGRPLSPGAVALMLDRVLRLDPARRLRGHLLWTLNPLLQA